MAQVKTRGFCFSRSIRQLLATLESNPNEVAKSIGVSYKTVSCWASGRALPRREDAWAALAQLASGPEDLKKWRALVDKDRAHRKNWSEDTLRKKVRLEKNRIKKAKPIRATVQKNLPLEVEETLPNTERVTMQGRINALTREAEALRYQLHQVKRGANVYSFCPFCGKSLAPVGISQETD